MMMGREEEDDLVERSQCSSGCQSGWTLYLEHSGQCCSPPPYQPVKRHTRLQAESNEEAEDSMVSDASSGPPPPPHLRDNGDELHGGQQDKLQLQQHSLSHHCYSSSGAHRSTTSGPGSRSFGSASSRSFGKVKCRKRMAAVAQRARAVRGHDGGCDDDDDLDDTASSSSAVFSYRGGEDAMDLQPSCALSAKHSPASAAWPAVRSTSIHRLSTAAP